MKRIILAVILSLAILPCFSQEDPKKLIDENKIWEYYNKYAHTEIDLWTYSHYKFDGKREAFGKMYHRWVFLDKEEYLNTDALNPEKDNWVVGKREINEEVALLREEEGRVYMLLDRDEIIVFDTSVDTMIENIPAYVKQVEPGEEILLYDFNLTANESYTSILNDSFLDTVVITETKNIRNSDIDYKEFNFYNAFSLWNYTYGMTPLPDDFFEDDRYGFLEKFRMKMVEGLGVVYGGTLTDFNPDYTEFDCRCFNITSLAKVYDLQGKILFQTPTPPRPVVSGIKEILATGDEAKSQIFDLFGHEISNPQPGTIYIRNGNKYIAK